MPIIGLTARWLRFRFDRKLVLLVITIVTDARRWLVSGKKSAVGRAKTPACKELSIQRILTAGGREVWAIPPHGNPILRMQFQALRYQEFAERRGWEASNPQKLEIDECDKGSTYILAFQSGELVSGCRLIDSELVLLPVSLFVSKIEKKSFEISRMVTSREVVDEGARAQIHHWIYSAVYHFAFGMRGYDYLYSHIRRCYLRKLRNIFGPNFFHALGPAARND